ncbi:MAG TPA: hypothetical protein VHJ82_03135, partial [Actinomycetota bacterium]|nr:hypothetical protein [Actinomycetota bacterium]
MAAVSRRTRFGALLVLIGILSLFVGLLSPSAFADHNGKPGEHAPDDLGNGNGPPDGTTGPPGNNGTIKIDGEPLKDPGEPHDPSNEPHVPCTFTLEYAGYEAMPVVTATHTFELQAPTLAAPGQSDVLLSGTAVIGDDDASGARDIDEIVPIDLGPGLLASGAVPHEQQGFHVKVTVNAPDFSQGSDVKHKVFWVEPCVTVPSPTPTPTPTPTPSAAARAVKVTLPAGFESGWAMTLTGPGGSPTETVSTNGAGITNFATELTEGTWNITEAQQPGWTFVSSDGCTFTVNFPAHDG